jgi:hypothetical protein
MNGLIVVSVIFILFFGGALLIDWLFKDYGLDWDDE